jgi:FtsH-binding integral membrane protein
MRNFFTSFWLWIFLLPLALDYKAADDARSHLAQILLVIPVLGAGFILELISPRFARKAKLRSIVSIALMVTVLGSIVPQLLEGNDFGNYLRVLLPFLLFLLG